MSRRNSLSRRQFVQSSAVLGASGSLVAAAECVALAGGKPKRPKAHIYKTLKIGMVRVKGSLAEKFAAAKEAGFGAIEMNSPGMNVAETKMAIAKSGLPVDGTVCSSHWQVRHTSPDAAERAKARDHLQTAIRDTHAVGGHSVLLVVGHGKDGEEAEIWKRSVENISKAIPLAAELGIHIAIENVWNHFLYDHAGDSKQTADKFVRYVDDFNSPWIGLQFDIGNHWKYGSMGDWIRQLGKRIVKLDVKGFSRAKNSFTSIGEGDIDFVDVTNALNEIKFVGWCAAEVGGGDLEHLKQVSANMDRVFGLV
ncbi:MAG: sugar phosphate isomerase/epimerase [Planctomycetota bacterium]|nr:sugar phosphate isomerase/epimerase [Planctomycetota bacterium]